MNRNVPTINTARITLRAMRPGDFDRFAEIWAMPDVVRHVGGEPWGRDEAWQSFVFQAGHWQVSGFGQWAIELHQGKKMLGQTGFFFGARGLGEDYDAHPEAAWFLDPEFAGRGLGREAAGAAHDWFDRVITGPLVCRVAPGNDASHRLAGILGYKVLREAVSDGRDYVLYIRKSVPQG
ncbi:GNAT family N-acetyltransferase [uncultured Tateyamaria sp.]|uniref:GNAT family N-acetyltransferase n=1 Tax=Tateyamaria sp. 1078 TaxID=3417464 RepID=UPI002606FB91|nr:GNAT family N-acetyltransferase [uncultured Tateyamaria sp.]